MKSILTALLCLFLCYNTVCQKLINEESVKQIKVDTTTKSEILTFFGEPETKTINSIGDTWSYNSPGDNGLNIYFHPDGRVSSYDYRPPAKVGGDINVKKTLFLDLVDKVFNDSKLKGTFIYKDSKAEIIEDNNYHTAVGRFMMIKWEGFEAIYHTKLGYMTKTRFHNSEPPKTYKVAKNKYCYNNNCVQLCTDKDKPYIFKYTQPDSEIRVIE